MMIIIITRSEAWQMRVSATLHDMSDVSNVESLIFGAVGKAGAEWARQCGSGDMGRAIWVGRNGSGATAWAIRPGRYGQGDTGQQRQSSVARLCVATERGGGRAGAPILEGPRAQNPYHQASDLLRSEVQANWARRGLPFRPYLHAGISRISGRDRQLPQMMYIFMPAPSRMM